MNEPSAQQKKAIKVPDLPRELYQDQIRHNEFITSNVPPFISTTESIVTEKFNSNPYLLRSTYYVLPASEYNLQSCGIPFAVSIQPFCDRGEYKEVKDLLQCKHCRTYFNCFTRIEEGSYFCNICSKKNDIIQTNLENLQFSSMQYTKPNPFVNSVTNLNSLAINPVFVFIFDFSSPLVTSNLFDSILNLCKDSNFQLLYENIVFISVNNGITVFTKNRNGLTKIKVLSDLPMISSKVVFKSNDIESIESILEHLKCEKNEMKESLAALDILSMIKNISSWASGVKVAIFSAFKDVDINYELWLETVKNVSLNIFSIKTENQQNLNKLCFYTSGQSFCYDTSRSFDITSDLSALVVTRTVYNVSIILKVSDNITKTGVISQSLEENLSVTHLNSMDSNTSALFTLSLNGMSKNIKCIQFQISFTDFDGLRKVRVLNQSFSTGTPQQFFACMSFDTIFYTLCKLSISDNIIPDDFLIKSLIFYRNKVSTNASSSQFVLPDSLKSLPVLIQAMHKKHNKDKAQIIRFNIEQCLRFFYPRLFCLSDYDGLAKTPCLRLTINNILNNEIYILENSQSIYIYAGTNSDQILLSKLFDLDSDPSKIILKKTEEEENLFIHSIIDEINLHYNYNLSVNVIFAGKSREEADFLGFMVEDDLNNCGDYLDYIFKMHFKVQKGQ